MRRLLLCLFLWSLPTTAAEPIETVLVPFTYAHEKGESLSTALELELELSESLLLTPADGVIDALDAPLAQADAVSRMRAMKAAGVKALIRAQPVPQTDYIAITLVRGRDGEVVFGLQVNVQDALKDPETLALELGAAVEEVEKLPALSDNAQKALLMPPQATDTTAGRRLPNNDAGGAPTAAPDEAALGEAALGEAALGPTPDKAGPETSAAPDEAAADEDAADDDDAAGDDDDEGLFAINAARDRIARVTFHYAPTFSTYRACQSPTPTLFSFLCRPSSGLPQTYARYPLFYGAAATVELFPWIPFIGLSFDGSLAGNNSVPIGFEASDGGPLYSVDDGSGNLVPSSSLYVLQGRLLSSLVGRFYHQVSFVGFSVGAKVGLLSQIQLVPKHYIVQGDLERRVTLIPGVTSYGLAVGGQASVGFSRWVRLLVEADVVPGGASVGTGLHCEGPTWVSSGPFDGAPQCAPFAAARGKAQVDVDVSYGVLLSARVEGMALSSTWGGQGNRETLALEYFNGGSVEMLSAQASLGVGYRF